MVVKPTSEEHQTCHHQTANCGAEELILGSDTRCSPKVEQTRSDLNTLETAANIAIQDILTDNIPDHLGAGFDVDWIGKPTSVVREFCSVVIHTTEPDKDNT